MGVPPHLQKFEGTGPSNFSLPTIRVLDAPLQLGTEACLVVSDFEKRRNRNEHILKFFTLLLTLLDFVTEPY